MSESEVDVSDMVVIILGADVVTMVVVSGDSATTFSVAARVFSVAVVIVVIDVSVTLLEDSVAVDAVVVAVMDVTVTLLEDVASTKGWIEPLCCVTVIILPFFFVLGFLAAGSFIANSFAVDSFPATGKIKSIKFINSKLPLTLDSGCVYREYTS